MRVPAPRALPSSQRQCSNAAGGLLAVARDFTVPPTGEHSAAR